MCVGGVESGAGSRELELAASSADPCALLEAAAAGPVDGRGVLLGGPTVADGARMTHACRSIAFHPLDTEVSKLSLV